MKSRPRIAVIHTSPATVDVFRQLLQERIPEAQIVNLLDDSILGELVENGGELAAIEPRFRDYVRIASEGKADIVLNACSSIGELCATVRQETGHSVIRVDALMARTAIERGDRIGVLATLPTTLRPTSSLIKSTAREMGREVAVDEALVDGAYEALMLGQRDRHDALVRAALVGLLDRNDIVLLAQASMARVAATLPGATSDRILASPSFAVEDVARALAGK